MLNKNEMNANLGARSPYTYTSSYLNSATPIRMNLSSFINLAPALMSQPLFKID